MPGCRRSGYAGGDGPNPGARRAAKRIAAAAAIGCIGLPGAADAEVRYTEKAIAGYPNCSVRENVAGARAQIDSLLTIYGSKRPKAQ